jgi:hypothetical protein
VGIDGPYRSEKRLRKAWGTLMTGGKTAMMVAYHGIRTEAFYAAFQSIGVMMQAHHG